MFVKIAGRLYAVPVSEDIHCYTVKLMCDNVTRSQYTFDTPGEADGCQDIILETLTEVSRIVGE